MKKLVFLLLGAVPAFALPRAVKDYAARVEGCNHWAGEEPYDKTRAAEIARAIDKLHCDRVERDGVALHRRYRGDPAALKALRNAKADF